MTVAALHGHPYDLAVPSIPERYEIEEKLASDELGSSFRALDRAQNRDVMVHVLTRRALGARYPAVLDRLMDARHLSLAVPSDIGLVNDDLLVALPVEHGRSLAATLQARGVMLPREAASIVARVAQGIALLHEHGIVHRDLRSESILLRDDGAIDSDRRASSAFVSCLETLSKSHPMMRATTSKRSISVTRVARRTPSSARMSSKARITSALRTEILSRPAARRALPCRGECVAPHSRT